MVIIKERSMMRYTLKLVGNISEKLNVKKIFQLAIYVVLFWIIIGFIVLPLFNTIKSSFQTDTGYSLKNYINYLSTPVSVEAIRNTFLLGISTVLICGLIGTALAFYITLVDVKLKKVIHTILLTPIMVPGVIIVIAFIQLYGESGMISKGIQILLDLPNVPIKLTGFWGILFVHAYTQYVYFYINVRVALKYLDMSTIEAAKSLGASKIKIFFTVILPEIVPALLSSTIVTFISGISSFSAPNLLGRRFKVLSTQILQSKANNQINIASAQVVILLLLGLSVLLIVRYYEKKHTATTSLRAVPIKPIKIQNKFVKILINIFIFCMLALIILPVIAIFVLSFVKPGTWLIQIFPTEFNFENYIKLISKRRVLQPFTNSMLMTMFAVIIASLVSLPTAYIISKRKNKINSIMEILLMLPWAMPASTIAINLINTFNQKNIFAFNKVLIGGYYILPIAYAITSIPLMLRTNLIALYSFNSDLENASKSLGAKQLRTFFKVVMPIIMPAIISGASLVFIRSLGEYTMSALLYGIYNKPISIAMVNAMNEFDIGLAMAYGVITIIISTTVMALFNKEDSTID